MTVITQLPGIQHEIAVKAIPDDERVFRFIALADERSILVQEKLDRAPALVRRSLACLRQPAGLAVSPERLRVAAVQS